MKFAHLADCHIGGWREENLRKLGIETFNKAVEKCIEENVGFLLISGDLFDTAIPSIEVLKESVAVLSKLKENNIDVYMVPGSHDYSPSGKTMLDVLEKAGLIVNVNNKVIEDKTGVKIGGIGGKRGGLEKADYEKFDKNIGDLKGFKIFMFHTALEEFKPEELKKVKAQSVATLPKGFNYYAGGHVHYIFDTKRENNLLTYPGALFPNNFRELEKFKFGGFYIVDENLNLEYVPIKLKDVAIFYVNADNKSAEEVEEEVNEILKDDFKDKIVLMRIDGVLKEGKVSDIKFKGINAYAFLRNTAKLKVREFEETKVEGNVEDIEEKIIEENLGQMEMKNEEILAKQLMNTLDTEKEEGERSYDFENRIVKDVEKILNETKQD